MINKWFIKQTKSIKKVIRNKFLLSNSIQFESIKTNDLFNKLNKSKKKVRDKFLLSNSIKLESIQTNDN